MELKNFKLAPTPGVYVGPTHPDFKHAAPVAVEKVAEVVARHEHKAKKEKKVEVKVEEKVAEPVVKADEVAEDAPTE